MLNIKNLLNSLENEGWYTQKEVLDNIFCEGLLKECHSRTLSKARIGNGSNKVINEDVRTDNISWLTNEEKNPYVLKYQKFINDLREELNKNFYLGLKDFEGHFAQYPTGSFYKPHLDKFKNDGKRIVTFIIYLNPNWKQGDGGELCLHLDNVKQKIEPKSGTIVCFMSDKILHEVLISNTDRIAISGWFLNN